MSSARIEVWQPSQVPELWQWRLTVDGVVRAVGARPQPTRKLALADARDVLGGAHADARQAIVRYSDGEGSPVLRDKPKVRKASPNTMRRAAPTARPRARAS